MLPKTKKKNKCLNTIITICILILVGSSLYADELSVDKALKLKVGDFRMHLGLELKESVLQKITEEGSANKIIEFSNWPHSPIEVGSSIANGDIRIRYEKDFIIIWYHSNVSLVKGRNTSLDVIRNVVNNILGEAFVIDEDDLLVIGENVVVSTGSTSSFKSTKAELITTSLPKEIPGTESIAFGYTAINGKRDWGLLLETVSILVKHKDAIVVMKKLKARTALDKPVYEGLIAAKKRLSKEEIEKARSKPVLARNVIFGEGVDVKVIPDDLLNGCMWSVDNKMVGVRDIGPSSKLGSKQENIPPLK